MISRQIMSEESHPRTLYVGNLDASVSEDLVCALFSQIGPVKGCKIIRETPCVGLHGLIQWST
ncbi:Nucleolysin TIAR [Zootermopsis nevadensis]|uniref:Nucleolysin TIAR n=1 Tax=Zootermopsis nevadensis TaxID=136037 RepID=A0A067QLD0_ZOONE|nr:Nucleolysin TIAR [Zootermopsis nevadensis]